jgi:LysR family transcriptional regulator, glycine cleavage system transcriptional activator
VRSGQLVAPFRSRGVSRRGYFVTLASHAARNPDAQDFARWLVAEAEQARAPEVPARKAPSTRRRA